MTTEIIITVCVLLLLAYLFDLSSKITKIPTVILLLLIGWLVRQGTGLVGWMQFPDLQPLLTVFGTIGLILIVLEGSLGLDYQPQKLKMIRKSVFLALWPMLVFSFALALAFHYMAGYDYKLCLINAIPLAIISSAIAIPSASNMKPNDKEFVVYETSLSDILGVILFNFIALNDNINSGAFGRFTIELLTILVVSFMATIGLSLLLNKINHHIKFGPIIIIVLLIYSVSKIYHLPGLIFILLFGLFLNNLDEFKRFKWIEKLQPSKLKQEVHQFSHIVGEAAFLVRSLFFILFGFLMETTEILNPATLLWAVFIVIGVFVIRIIFLRLAKIDLYPLVFLAPRGLITILLFLSISPEQQVGLVNKSLIIQVVLLTAIIMMVGMMLDRRKAAAEDIKDENASEKEAYSS